MPWDETPTRTPETRAPAKKTVIWDDYDDIPDRGSLAPPTRESDFRRLLRSKIDDKPARREPGAPPLTSRLGASPLAPAQRQEQQEDVCKRVHILGFDPRAYSIAYELAGCNFLDPVKLLIHKRILMNNWQYEGKRLMMVKDDKVHYRKHVEAEWVGKGSQPISKEHIEQLIVTIPCRQTRVAIENLAHRIDHRTTICLIQDGLGVVEELNEHVFTDMTRRPTYILGHFSASVGYVKQVFYSTVLRTPGKLYLTALEKGIGQFSLIKFHPPVEARSAATSFLHTLSTVPNLGAGAYGLEPFLCRKLPAMTFHSVIEPLAIALDGDYMDVLRNETAMNLADDLLGEIFNVIWAMPELMGGGRVMQHCSRDALRKYAVQRLASKGKAQSQMVSQVRAGKMVDVDYLNGYFIKRGKELGIKMPQNEMMVDVIKARVEGRESEIKGLIPMQQS